MTASLLFRRIANQLKTRKTVTDYWAKFLYYCHFTSIKVLHLFAPFYQQ